MPAQVPNTASPSAMRGFRASNNPEVSSNRDIVVDSPPGIAMRIEPGKVVRAADLAHLCTELSEGVSVGRERALQGEDADAWTSDRSLHLEASDRSARRRG